MEIAGFLIHLTFFSLGQSVEKINPATGVTAANWVSFDFNVSFTPLAEVTTVLLNKHS